MDNPKEQGLALCWVARLIYNWSLLVGCRMYRTYFENSFFSFIAMKVVYKTMITFSKLSPLFLVFYCFRIFSGGIKQTVLFAMNSIILSQESYSIYYFFVRCSTWTYEYADKHMLLLNIFFLAVSFVKKTVHANIKIRFEM